MHPNINYKSLLPLRKAALFLRKKICEWPTNEKTKCGILILEIIREDECEKLVLAHDSVVAEILSTFYFFNL